MGLEGVVRQAAQRAMPDARCPTLSGIGNLDQGYRTRREGTFESLCRRLGLERETNLMRVPIVGLPYGAPFPEDR